jgi:hypothetical protein
MRIINWLIFSTILVVACASHGSTTTPTYAILDAKVACDIEAAWPTPHSADCGNCISLSQVAECGCPTGQIQQRAQCSDEASARAQTADCDVPLGHCIEGCTQNDCACVDACYQGHTECRNAQGKLDSCVINACKALCAGDGGS